mmetsp:Transcript_38690/g.106575  ORF Transcript_38690/g.106575 Transcript_38690/m.106575 type:complete len:255 (+) Transcript_38690:61-825(+)
MALWSPACASRAFAVVILTTALAPVWAGVAELTDGDFESVTNAESRDSAQDWLIDFYAPNCSRSKEIDQFLDKLTLRLKRRPGRRISVGAVNGHRETVTARRFSLTEFPSLIIISSGYAKQYGGPLKEDDIFQWATKGHKLLKGSVVRPEPDLVSKLVMILEEWSVWFEGKFPAFRRERIRRIFPFVGNFFDQFQSEHHYLIVIFSTAATLVSMVLIAIVWVAIALAIDGLPRWLQCWFLCSGTRNRAPRKKLR